MKQIKIGWLYDRGSWAGGAEMNAAALAKHAPANVQIVDCPPNAIVTDCDIYVVHNCTSYGADIIPQLRGKRVIKMLHDIWVEGDAVLRAWLLSNAAVTILVSPTMRDWIQWEIKTPFRTCPSLVDFGNESGFYERKDRALWIGRLHAQKGVKNAIDWAAKNNIELDVYGFGDEALVEGANFKGELKPNEVINTMRQYKTFVFLPTAPDACPRVIFEAHFAGCEIVTNGWQGASYWLDANPAAIMGAGARFWEYVIN